MSFSDALKKLKGAASGLFGLGSGKSVVDKAIQGVFAAGDQGSAGTSDRNASLSSTTAIEQALSNKALASEADAIDDSSEYHTIARLLQPVGKLLKASFALKGLQRELFNLELQMMGQPYVDFVALFNGLKEQMLAVGVEQKDAFKATCLASFDAGTSAIEASVEFLKRQPTLLKFLLAQQVALTSLAINVDQVSAQAKTILTAEAQAKSLTVDETVDLLTSAGRLLGAALYETPVHRMPLDKIARLAGLTSYEQTFLTRASEKLRKAFKKHLSAEALERVADVEAKHGLSSKIGAEVLTDLLTNNDALVAALAQPGLRAGLTYLYQLNRALPNDNSEGFSRSQYFQQPSSSKLAQLPNARAAKEVPKSP